VNNMDEVLPIVLKRDPFRAGKGMPKGGRGKTASGKTPGKPKRAPGAKRTR